jgi:hypothetical protein
MASRDPVALHERAADNLRFIRETMERAGSFTAVPGVAGMFMGGTAVLSAWLAHIARAAGPGAWLQVWLGCLLVSLIAGGTGLALKARRFSVPLFTGVGRKFALSLAPALLVGAVLTLALTRWGIADSLPGVWMLLYGAGIATGGAFSIRLIPILGVLFMIAGTITLFLPVWVGDYIMAATFGGLHIVFGGIVARRHGG